MNEETLSKQNKQWAEQLTKEQRNYYDDVVRYLKLNYFSKQDEVEAVLAELIDHLWTTKTVPDITPQQWAESVSPYLPKPTWQRQVMSYVTFSLTWLLPVPILSMMAYRGNGVIPTIATLYGPHLAMTIIVTIEMALTWRLRRRLFGQPAGQILRIASFSVQFALYLMLTLYMRPYWSLLLPDVTISSRTILTLIALHASGTYWLLKNNR